MPYVSVDITNGNGTRPSNWQTLPLLISNTTTYRAANGDLLNAVFVGGGTLDLVTGDVAFSRKEMFNERDCGLEDSLVLLEVIRSSRVVRRTPQTPESLQ